jgi:hypothetical protein
MPPKPATRSSNQTNPAAARHRSDAAGGDISSSDSSVQEPPKHRAKTHDESESFDGKQNDSGDDESLPSSSDELEEPHPLVDNKSAKGASKSDDVSKSKKTSAAAKKSAAAATAKKSAAAAKGGGGSPL